MKEKELANEGMVFDVRAVGKVRRNIMVSVFKTLPETSFNEFDIL